VWAIEKLRDQSKDELYKKETKKIFVQQLVEVRRGYGAGEGVSISVWHGIVFHIS
jgi:hypothetical protein